jgi:hypothetical protein
LLLIEARLLKWLWPRTRPAAAVEARA